MNCRDRDVGGLGWPSASASGKHASLEGFGGDEEPGEGVVAGGVDRRQLGLERVPEREQGLGRVDVVGEDERGGLRGPGARSRGAGGARPGGRAGGCRASLGRTAAGVRPTPRTLSSVRSVSRVRLMAVLSKENRPVASVVVVASAVPLMPIETVTPASGCPGSPKRVASRTIPGAAGAPSTARQGLERSVRVRPYADDDPSIG